MAVEALVRSADFIIATAFDADFYEAVYPDVVAEGVRPLQHYLTGGWQENRDPAPWFSTGHYQRLNPDVKAAGIDPFHHYLTVGRRQGRVILPSDRAQRYFGGVDWNPAPWGRAPRRSASAAATVRRMAETEVRDVVRGSFDAAFYLAMNPDVAASGMDPLDHFIRTGWMEDRDPTPEFSARDYLEANPDVAAVGMNPFAHYLLAGRAEGRRPRHGLGFRYDIIARLKPLARRIEDADAQARAIAVQPAARLAEALAGAGDLHITFSHDDYIAHSGGLQSCVRRESAEVQRRGRRHLHLFPAAAWQVVRKPDEPGPLGVLLDGEALGAFSAGAVRTALQEVGGKGRRSFAIHSLLGHEPDDTADILAAAGLTQGFFWLHDFASLCASFHLLRNDVADCAAPPPDSAGCGICAYGPFRARHLDGHRRLFERLRLTVVAPSQTTLDFWRARSDLPTAGAVVAPHARLVPKGPAPSAAGDRPFRIAYLGMPTALKGWPVFRALAQGLAGDPRYQFLHLGGRADPATREAEFHPVTVTAESPRAMQDAVGRLEVDAALIWPLCRETFSLTAYEAAAGGAAVLTGPDTGNVAAFVAETRRGRVLADDAALMAAFASGEVLALARTARQAQVFDLAYGALTAELVDA